MNTGTAATSERNGGLEDGPGGGNCHVISKGEERVLAAVEGESTPSSHLSCSVLILYTHLSHHHGDQAAPPDQPGNLPQGLDQGA